MRGLLRTLKIFAVILFVGLGGALVFFSLPATGWKALSVQTGSMEPAIPAGSLLFVHSVPAAELRAGDVITYKSKDQSGQTITHRLVERKGEENGPKQYIVKGDANKEVDKPVSETQLVGRVDASVPQLGRALDFLKTPVGLLLFIYLPALLIFIDELRLLVRRLSKIEIEKHKKAQEAAAPPMPISEPATIPVAPTPVEQKQPLPQPKQRPLAKKRRVLNGLSLLALLVGGASIVGPTQAALNSSATLTNNRIAMASEGDHPMIIRVDFPGAPNDQVSFQPIVVLFNPVRRTVVDIEGWRLESSSGLVFGFRGPTPLFARNHLDVHPGPSGKLLIPGDYLVLKNKAGQVVDSLSWGTNTSQLTPAIQGVSARKFVKRVNNSFDTNKASDWMVKPLGD